MNEMGAVIGVVKKWLWKTEDQQEIFAPDDLEVTFTLSFHSLEIGTLRLNEGKWTFAVFRCFKHKKKSNRYPIFPN